MSQATELLLGISQLTIPALIVYLTVRRMLESHFENSLRIKRMEYAGKDKDITLPLRLQAYERLALFCERISIPNLSLRMRSGQKTVNDMRVAMLYAVQQEYEHNISQQIYVTDGLWQIINVAKDQTAFIIDQAAQQFDTSAPPQAYIEALLQANNSTDAPPLEQALRAIRKEAATHL